jgi:hypothetical protein
MPPRLYRAAETCRYAHSTDAGSLELTGPALWLLAPEELREFVAFLGLVTRQAERIASQKEASGEQVPLVADAE